MPKVTPRDYRDMRDRGDQLRVETCRNRRRLLETTGTRRDWHRAPHGINEDSAGSKYSVHVHCLYGKIMALDLHALIEGLGGIGDILPYSCERSKDNAKKIVLCEL